ncbi:MAG: IS1595 family transposase, partial [Blastochloris sp.]|nr:IS1595 family transposase [Blastochloris sp.]
DGSTGRDGLAGIVEVDETYVGGPEKGARGREVETKAIVLVAAEKSGRGVGRIRLRRAKDVSGDRLRTFVQDAVVPGSVVHTDGWKGYAGLASAGYEHQVTVIKSGAAPAHEAMPRVHMVASLLKRWLIGTHQGGIQHQHFDYYLDEFTFRFNRRRSHARGLLFHRLAQQAVAVGPAPYPQIIATNDSAPALGAT